ncbi:unnamed protein product [Lactuca virosa]|uniref:Uncharacterized protein n=1 Tax=Lactuca virosa TaxID=75947 RepID=A0AAU9MA49_9ASTR|nr:unnamed protein product [Lactuca virosa]
MLNSTNFGYVNAALQTATIRLGIHQACVEMKNKYPKALYGNNDIYSYPDAQCHILYHFSDMVTYTYSLFEPLEGDKVDINVLKERLAALDPLFKCDNASTSA